MLHGQQVHLPGNVLLHGVGELLLQQADGGGVALEGLAGEGVHCPEREGRHGGRTGGLATGLAGSRVGSRANVFL